jgi:hypothetical protein
MNAYLGLISAESMEFHNMTMKQCKIWIRAKPSSVWWPFKYSMWPTLNYRPTYPTIKFNLFNFYFKNQQISNLLQWQRVQIFTVMKIKSYGLKYTSHHYAEMAVIIYETTWCHHPEYHNRNSVVSGTKSMLGHSLLSVQYQSQAKTGWNGWFVRGKAPAARFRL